MEAISSRMGVWRFSSVSRVRGGSGEEQIVGVTFKFGFRQSMCHGRCLVKIIRSSLSGGLPEHDSLNDQENIASVTKITSTRVFRDNTYLMAMTGKKNLEQQVEIPAR